MSPSLLLERVGPGGRTDLLVEADQHHVEVVEVAELLLEPDHRGRESSLVTWVEQDGEVGELARSPDPDPEPVEPCHGRPSERLAVGPVQVLVRSVVR